jgi:hypothetical protein
MPIGPNRNGSGESMMQYTYLPRLVRALASGDAFSFCSTFSAGRVAFGGRARVTRATGALASDSFVRPFPFTVLALRAPARRAAPLGDGAAKA